LAMSSMVAASIRNYKPIVERDTRQSVVRRWLSCCADSSG